VLGYGVVQGREHLSSLEMEKAAGDLPQPGPVCLLKLSSSTSLGDQFIP
jgi:hypothetical protein